MALPPQLVLRTAQTGALNSHGIERMVSVPARRTNESFERTSPSMAYRPVARQAVPQPMDGRPRVIHASHVAPPGQWSSPRAPLSSTARTQLQQVGCAASSPRPEGLDLLSRSSRELQAPGPMGLYTNARASLVGGAAPPLWAGSPPLSPRFAVVSPRGQHVAYQAERPGLWEQHRLQAMQQMRRSAGSEVQQVQQVQQVQLHHPGTLESDPSQRYIVSTATGTNPPEMLRSTKRINVENICVPESETKNDASESQRSVVIDIGQVPAPKQGSGHPPPREKLPTPEEEPLQTTSQLVDETRDIVPRITAE
eukprot:symbB.v1.2.023092.t1/scaffold2090.1/size89944/1